MLKNHYREGAIANQACFPDNHRYFLHKTAFAHLTELPNKKIGCCSRQSLIICL